jgi:penicillin-binding protein A
MFLMFLIIIIKLSFMQTHNLKASLGNLKKLSTKIVYGPSMPRGRILDRNYNVIVDNVGTNIISYKKEANVSVKDEIDYAYLLAEKIDINYAKLTKNSLKDFWIVNNKEKADKKITDKEYKLYERRKLKAKDLEALKKMRITDEELSIYSDIDKKSAYIYYLMNHGYSYDDKVIKEDITPLEYAFVAQNKNNLKGFSVSSSWKRTYPYGDTLRQILGNVSTSEQGILKSDNFIYMMPDESSSIRFITTQNTQSDVDKLNSWIKSDTYSVDVNYINKRFSDAQKKIDDHQEDIESFNKKYSLNIKNKLPDK